MLGGDPYKNNLGNQLIIKCPKCGDTDMRNVSFFRTASGEPSGYVCGNGHEVWGAIDDWDIWGQSDIQLTPVKFYNTCDGINDNMPNSITVQFSGILGVQARESCAQSISEDIRARLKMPIQHCGPCCESENTTGNNSPWYINCGCDTASGPCSTSNDLTQNPYTSCGSDIQTGTTQCFGVDVLSSVDKDSIQVFSNIPANPDGGVPGTPPAGSIWYSTGPSCAAISVPGADLTSTGCDFDPIAAGFFAGGYPEAYGSSGPAFITEVAGSSGNLWSNQAHAINFIVRDQRHFHWINPCDHDEGFCYAGKRTFYIAKRTHPTATATGNSGFTWTVSQEGIADTVIEFSCGQEECSATWESPSIDPYSFTNFCDPSNGALPCTNCNNSVGQMSVTYCNNDGQRRFWPFRVPYYKTPDGDYQLLRKDADKYPTAWECNCRGAGYGVCDDTVTAPIFPEYCTKNISYPDCLSHGTYKCVDVDKRWRVPCANPSEYFIGYLTSTGYESILNYRYSVDLSGPAQTSDIKSAIITFNPIYEGRDGRADTFSFPVSPNPVCAGLDRKGYVSNFGDPTPTMRNGDNTYWYDNSSPIKYTAGAVGIRTARLSQIFALPEAQVQQPHCLRRVKNANLSKSYPYYQVNTADVSQQRMILDRYYYTNDYFDYLWSGVQLAEPDVTGQPFINRQGDRGLFDFLTGQLYPYSFTSRSGSVEEPELVAVIHSQNGRGGQIAFQTMPVTTETDQLIDPADALTPDAPYCDFKTRVHVLGYGVMYPLVDDPIWSNPVDTTEWLGLTYDPNNPIFDTTTVRKSAFEYPVFIPGTGYEIGDKIEFRAWRTLQNDASAFNPSSEIESVWEEECVERVVATATITELNDERIAPTTVTQNLSEAFISVETVACTGIKRYHEQWRLKSVDIKDDSDGGYNIGDTIQIRFSDTDGLGNTVYYSGTPPYVQVAATGVSGVIESVEIPVSGSGAFYKIIRTGGIRWYEFDEVDEDTGDLLISVGTCPCSYDVCGSECNGCVSKDMYPSGHNKLDAINDGFPGSPWHNCVTDPALIDPETDKPYELFCPGTIGSISCGGTCTYTSIYTGGSSDSLGWILLNKDICANRCGCGYPSEQPTSYHQTATADCYCSVPLTMDGLSLFEGSSVPLPGSNFCWPLNKTYEFPEKEVNYARCACSGDPVVPASYAYMDGRFAMPYRRAQYKYQWLPNISGFQTKVGDYLADGTSTEDKNSIIDSFLGFDACNPGKYDRFNRSYRWPTKENSALQPCRKKLNTTDTIPPNVTRTLDNYCRVYGFYQQRQPNCKNILYRGQYIMRAAYKGAGFHDAAVAKLGDCDPSYYPQDGHGWSDCDPIVEDIVIGFNKMEAQFDVSVGAPYDQDILIPENLPKPFVGPDGKKEVRADSWDIPSLQGLNNPIFYDHGFYEPNRYQDTFQMALPENQEGLGIGEGPVLTWVFAVNALMAIYDVDYNDGVITEGAIPSQTPTPSISWSPTPTPSITASNTATPSVTPSITVTTTPTASLTPTPTPTATLTSTPTPTVTYTPSVTQTPTASPTPTISVTPSVTPSAGAPPSPTPSPTRTTTPTPTPTPTRTPTPSASVTTTPTPSPTRTSTPTPSITKSNTPTRTPTRTPTPTVSVTSSITPTVTPTLSVTPTITPSISITPTPSRSFVDLIDAGHSGILDWPDPRNNCKPNNECREYNIPISELYPEGNVPLDYHGVQNNFIEECLYPWENYKAGVSGVDHYCMFQNNSAELTLGEIEYCSGCLGSVLIYDRSDERFYGPYYNQYGQYISYTYKIQYGFIQDPDNPGKSIKLYILFRAFGKENDSFAVQAFRDVIDQYIDIWRDRYRINDVPIDKILAADIHRSILWNMLFEGASNDKLEGLTKVEIFNLEVESEDLGSYGIVSKPLFYGRIFVEDRCEYHEHTGGIKSINVLNGGSGYAFEIEERVAPTGIIGVNDALMTVSTIPVSRKRRRETYGLATVGIAHTGVGYSVNDVIDINFNDSNAAREGVVIVRQPKIRVVSVNPSGTITGFNIADPGEFYKYFKTGEHRAFPVAVVLNNYWDYPNGAQNIGRHARFTPVVGVDPNDPETYGKIKRVDMEFAGIEYVSPGQYWAINTKMADYDDYDNIKNGLDIQHLVDPCKYNIAGDGFNSDQVNEYYDWMWYPENNPNGTVFFPERQALWIESPNENIEPSIGDPFIHSKKYYLRTRSSSPHVTKWAERVKDWNTILISGSSPIDASGGLLNRTYHMALVEEAYLHSKRAHTGFCSASECENYIDYNDISCNEDGAIYPGQQRVKECGTPCPVFTVYDAHRFNIEGTAQLKEDLFARPGPWLLGCPQRLVLDTEAKKQLYCYDAYQITYGGQLQTQGYTTWDMIANPIDQCFNADYSLYAEFGKWTNGANQTNVPAMRIKAITYAMSDDPITMKVSYNKERDKRDIPVDYDDGQCNTEPRPSSSPLPVPTPTPSSFPSEAVATASIGESGNNVVLRFTGSFATAGIEVNSMTLEQKRNFISARTDSNLEQLSITPDEASQQSYNVIWLYSNIPAFATGNNSAFYADTYNVQTAMMFKVGQPALFIDRNYTPNTTFTNEVVFSGLTLADLGITQDLDYSMITRDTRERFRIVIEAPDPIV